ncbi:hypothetical protein FB567DRAFT_586152 [Paraphoma chrysanthemicola]|uniref:Uncharacterized protein n=1 Tax=Paraphoma chrysanthemicola TaxID=798071 RepID=A0A8K0RH99_9PLEO|nr:hypothetical protein FB567DRAFT_586152 [Paraphoma chrysanthemicola]
MATGSQNPGTIVQAAKLLGVMHIIVCNGNIKKDFYVATSLLRERAPGFINFYPSHNGEMGSVLALMNNIPISHFSLFVEWLGTDAGIDPKATGYNPLAVGDQVESPAHAVLATNAYIFGERYGIPRLCNDALYRLSVCMAARVSMDSPTPTDSPFEHNPPNPFTLKQIRYAYQNTRHASPLRELYVDSFCAAGLEASVLRPSALCQYPQEFLADVMVRRAHLDGYQASMADAKKPVLERQAGGGDDHVKRTRID